ATHSSVVGVDPASGVSAVGTNVGTVDAFDSEGKRLWSLQLGANAIQGSPALPHSVVYIGSMGGQFFALDEQTGKILWQQPVRGGVDNAPTGANGIVYVAAGGFL